MITGEWELSDYYHDLDIETLSGGATFEMLNSKEKLLSSSGKIIISENPNMIAGQGFYVSEITQNTDGNISTFEHSTELFLADNWIKTDNELELFGEDFINGASKFVIESLTEYELIISEQIDAVLNDPSGFDFKISGNRTFTFIR